MLIVEVCPCCGGRPATCWPALVAPFIADYVLAQPVAACRLLECGSCGFRWFDGRFEPHEMARLYKRYRGDAYFRSRHRHEPWYTRDFCKRTGVDPVTVARRQGLLKDFFARHLDLNALESVLDYGGDSGQLIPEGVGSEKWVFDPSDSDPMPGVQRVPSESDLVRGGYDLVILNHVLEHIPDPGEMLSAIRSLVTQGNGVVYIEVPLERFSLRWMGSGKLTRKYLDILRRSGPLLKAMDLYSSAFRVKFAVIPPLGFPKLHEHINFFTSGSLTHLLERCGYEVFAMGSTSRAPEARKPDSIGCLARV